MATSRRGLTGITFAVGLGVAVTTSQGVANADSTDPGSPQADPPSTATTPASTDGPVSQDADGGQGAEQKQPLAKKRPRSLLDGTRITIRRENAKAAAKDDGKPAAADNTTVAADDDTDPPVEQTPEALDEPQFDSAPFGSTARASATHSRSTTRALLANPPRTLTIGVPDRNAVPARDTEASPERRTATFANPQELEAATSLQLRQSVSTFDMDRIAILHAPLTPSLRVEAPAAAAAVATAAVPRSVTNFLSALGLRPSPIAPTRPVLPLPRLLELAFVAIRRTFFNETPTARLDESTFEVNSSTGVATGQIIGSDPDGDRLRYRLATPPAQGHVDLRQDGTFTYTPPDGWTHTTGGDVTFTIAVSDATSPHLHLFTGGGHVTTQTVSFSYSASNAAPVVQVSDGVVQPDGTVTYTVKTSDADGDAVQLTTDTRNGSLQGSLTSDTNGVKEYAYTFTPDKKYAHDLTIGGKTDPGEGEATFTVSDGLGGTDKESRTVTINGVNSDPTVTVDPQAGGVYEITLFDGDGDSVALTPSVTNGTLTETKIDATHYRYTFAVDPKWQHDLTLPGGGGSGTATVGFVATDGHGGNDEYSQDIDFAGTNAKPVLTVTPRGNGVYDVEVTDTDQGDVVTIKPTATNGTLTETKIDATHYRYTFTADPKWQHDLTLPGQPGTGQATVSFVATDDHQGVSETKTDTLTVVGTNAKPVLTVTPRGNGVYDVEVTDTDQGDVVTIKPTATNGTLTETKIDATHYRYTFTADPKWQHDLTLPGQPGTGQATVSFVATDDHQGVSETKTDTLTVVGTNAEPTVVTEGSTEISSRDGRAQFTIKGAADADGDAATITSVSVVPGQESRTTVVKNSDGTWTVTYRADYAEAHKLGPNGHADVPAVIVTMTDGHGAEPTTQQISVGIVGLNQEPVLATEPIVDRDTGIVSGTAIWTDKDGAATLKNFTAAVSDPTKGQFKYNPATGKYTFTPTADARLAAEVVNAPIDDRRVIVTFTVTDEFGEHSEDVPVLIAPRDNQILASFPSDEHLTSRDRPNSVVVTQDGNNIFVANEDSGFITQINAQTGEIVQGYNVGDIFGEGSTKQLIATQSATNPAVYALDGQGRLMKIERTVNSEGDEEWIASEPVTLPGFVDQIAVSKDGSTVYFSSDEGSLTRLRYLDTATMTVKPLTDRDVPIVFLADDPGPMVVDQRTGFLVIDNGDLVHGYTVIDPATGVATKGAPVDVEDYVVSGQDLIGLDPSGSVLFRVPIVGTNEVSFSIPVPNAKKVVVSADGERAYVLTGNNAVTVLDITKDATQRQLGRITGLPPSTTDIAISPDGTHLYVTSFGPQGDTVTSISIIPGDVPTEPSPPSVL